jgi:hypothetical protein
LIESAVHTTGIQSAIRTASQPASHDFVFCKLIKEGLVITLGLFFSIAFNSIWINVFSFQKTSKNLHLFFVQTLKNIISFFQF